MWIPVLLLGLAPAVAVAAHRGWLRRSGVRWTLGAVVVGVALLALPYGGEDFERLKHVKMLLAFAVAVVLGWHALRPWRAKTLDRTLLVLAILGVLNWFNYGAFHGQRVFVHWHDVAHYYLGAKYYEELGYTDLYVAMLRAEAENHSDHFRALEARDLTDYRRVDIRELLRKSDPVKASFAADRWFDFRRDADYFRENLREHYGKVLLDHGFNPTPVWALLGGALAQGVSPGSGRGLFLLSLLDPLLLILAFAALGWAFGRRTLILSVLLFTVILGATFGWIGGAFLRYTWFFGVVAGLACLRKRRYGAAGGLFALATMLRVFPFFFLLPLAAKAAWGLWRHRRLERRYLRLAVGFVAVAAALFVATGLLPRGYAHWGEFSTNMQLHLKNIAPNVVGLTEVVAHRWGVDGLVTQEEFDALKERRHRLQQVQRAIFFLPLALVIAWTSRRRGDLMCIALAFPLLLSGLSLAAYYYAFLVLLIPIFRRSTPALSLIFLGEAIAFSLRLFEDADARLFIYRAVGLLWLYGFLLIRWRRPADIIGSPSPASPAGDGLPVPPDSVPLMSAPNHPAAHHPPDAPLATSPEDNP